MDRHTDWLKAKQELSEASKQYDVWLTMPAHVRSRMSTADFKRRRSLALQALRRADNLCRSASVAARLAARAQNEASGF